MQNHSNKRPSNPYPRYQFSSRAVQPSKTFARTPQKQRGSVALASVDSSYHDVSRKTIHYRQGNVLFNWNPDVVSLLFDATLKKQQHQQKGGDSEGAGFIIPSSSLTLRRASHEGERTFDSLCFPRPCFFNPTLRMGKSKTFCFLVLRSHLESLDIWSRMPKIAYFRIPGRSKTPGDVSKQRADHFNLHSSSAHQLAHSANLSGFLLHSLGLSPKNHHDAGG